MREFITICLLCLLGAQVVMTQYEFNWWGLLFFWTLFMIATCWVADMAHILFRWRSRT